MSKRSQLLVQGVVERARALVAKEMSQVELGLGEPGDGTVDSSSVGLM